MLKQAKRIFLLHGYFGSETSYFFPSLTKLLSAAGHTVYCPSLPDPEHPKLANWSETVKEWLDLGPVDLAICHSLGGTFVMSLISQELIQLDSLIVLGSSFGPKNEVPLNDFLIPPIDLNKLAQLKNLYAVSSYDDPWTHHEYSTLLVKQCKAVGIFFGDQGHFEKETLPPEVLMLIQKCLAD